MLFYKRKVENGVHLTHKKNLNEVAFTSSIKFEKNLDFGKRITYLTYYETLD